MLHAKAVHNITFGLYSFILDIGSSYPLLKLSIKPYKAPFFLKKEANMPSKSDSVIFLLVIFIINKFSTSNWIQTNVLTLKKLRPKSLDDWGLLIVASIKYT